MTALRFNNLRQHSDVLRLRSGQSLVNFQEFDPMSQSLTKVQIVDVRPLRTSKDEGDAPGPGEEGV